MDPSDTLLNLRSLQFAVVRAIRPDNQSSVPHGFKHWPHGVAQTVTFSETVEPEFGRTYLFVHIETDHLREIPDERSARTLARHLALVGVGGIPVVDGHRVRLRTHLRLPRIEPRDADHNRHADVHQAELAADTAMAQACITYFCHRALERGAVDGLPPRHGVPDRTVHPEQGARLVSLESLAERLYALDPSSLDRRPRAALSIVAHVHRYFVDRRFTSVEGGAFDGWVGIRYDLEAVDTDAALESRGRDDGLAVAYARLDSGLWHPWFGSTIALRTLVPVPEWVVDADGDAWAERFDAAEREPGAPGNGLGGWVFDARFRRWVYTSVQPVAWLRPNWAVELLSDMGRRAMWWLRTQRPLVLAARAAPIGHRGTSSDAPDGPDREGGDGASTGLGTM